MRRHLAYQHPDGRQWIMLTGRWHLVPADGSAIRPCPPPSIAELEEARPVAAVSYAPAELFAR